MKNSVRSLNGPVFKLKYIFCSLLLYFDRFKSGWELDIVLKMLREADSGFFPGRAYIFFSF